MLNKLLNLIGKIFKIIAIILYIVWALWSTYVLSGILIKIGGFLALLIGYFLLPVVELVAPIYALLVWGDWNPLFVCYGVGIIATIFGGIGSMLSGDD